jgi:hypothetical protein
MFLAFHGGILYQSVGRKFDIRIDPSDGGGSFLLRGAFGLFGSAGFRGRFGGAPVGAGAFGTAGTGKDGIATEGSGITGAAAAPPKRSSISGMSPMMTTVKQIQDLLRNIPQNCRMWN